jgi:uncharacterized membrane protein
LIHAANIIVQVISPDFDISASPSYLYVIAGTSASSMVRLNPDGRFNGTIALTSTYPTGWAANLSPTSVQIKYNAAGSSALSISVPSGAVAGKYVVTVTGKSGGLNHEVNVTVQVISPDFDICASPSYQYVIAGSNANSIIKLSPDNRFNGTIVLSAAYPTGWTGTFTPVSVEIKYNAAGSSTLAISVPSGAAAGKYVITVTGKSGALTHEVNVTLQVIKPDFDISASPSSLYVVAGSSANSMIRLNSDGRFNGTIALTATYPNGWTVNLSPTSVPIKYNAAGSSTLSISVPSGTAAGKYVITVAGTSGALIHATNIIVQVIYPDFSISSSPSNLYLVPGASANIAIKVQSLSRFNGTITLVPSMPTLPSVWSSNLAKSSLIVLNGGTSSTTLSITVPSNAPTGTYAITITGTSGTLTHPTSVKVIVK